MEHILELYLVNIQSNMRGFIFGFVHVAIMLVGYYSGWSINRLLKIMSNGYIAGIIGAALAHIVADLVASLIDPHVRSMVVGIVLGGLILSIFIFILFSSKLTFDKSIVILSKFKFTKNFIEPLSKSHEILKNSTKPRIFISSTILSVLYWLTVSLAVLFVLKSLSIVNFYNVFYLFTMR